jgi:predicted AlkP superfamily pyrophosphatase or phosphodiesterase
MKSVFPAYTYPSHTAMLTGALPARSGIYFNQPKGSKGEWNWYAKYIKVPTLWQALHKAGLRTAAVQWPVSVGAEIDYTIPEIWSVERPDDRISESQKYSTSGLVEEIERNATGKLDADNVNDNYFSLDENAGRMAAYIFKTYRPAFLAVHFACVDGREHELGRDGEEVRLALETDDRAIGDIIEMVEKTRMKDSTTIIVVGDHGFCSLNEIFRPNMLIRDLPARFTAAGGSAFLYSSTNLSEEEKTELGLSVRQRLDSLPENKRKLFRIIGRSELDRMGADSSAILALSAEPGLVFSGAGGTGSPVNHGPGTSIQESLLEGVFIPTAGGHHGYDPSLPDMYTGFIAWGAGVQKGAKVNELCVTDIAPLVSSLLGVSFTCPDGHLTPGILSEPNK